MPLSREAFEQRAIKTGVKASKRRHHLVSEEELLALRIQIMPSIVRWFLVLLGIALVAACWFAWPARSDGFRALEAIFGVLSLFFGAFGVRRTLSKLLDSVDAGHAVEGLIDLIGEALSGIEL